MDYQAWFHKLHSFLESYQAIWENEIMLLYPNGFDIYPKHLIEEISLIENQVDLEKRSLKKLKLSKELFSFLNTINELTAIPSKVVTPFEKKDRNTFLRISEKKQYEIKRILPLVEKLKKEHKLTGLIDIGGGVGLMAQVISSELKLKVTSIDREKDFQQSGVSRQEKYLKSDDHITYLNFDLAKNKDDFYHLIDETKMTLGLHTCGPLSVFQIDASINNKAACLNFPCCYHKLTCDDVNISSLAKRTPLKLNSYALTLAARAHQKYDEKALDQKYRVKFYRYTMHFLLKEFFDQDKIVGLGNSRIELYSKPFSVYASEQFSRLKLSSPLDDEQLNGYFSEKIPLLTKMRAMGVFREALGRVLEVYILVDRILYIQDHGIKADLHKVFDEEISPRNLAISF